MQVICLQDEAFYALVENLVRRIKENFSVKGGKWIPEEEAMRLSHITDKAILQKLRDKGEIRFSQPDPKIVLYDVDSINDYLSKEENETL